MTEIRPSLIGYDHHPKTISHFVIMTNDIIIGVKVWNELSDTVKTCKSMFSFKKSLKIELLSKY